MESPLQVSYKGFEPSESVQALIERRAGDLERVFDRITRCLVVVEQPHQRRRTGSAYTVRIHLGVPGHELVVDRGPGRNERHVEAHPAIRDAFDAMEKQLRTWVSRVRLDIKTHDEAPEAIVESVFPEDDHGFLRTRDGRVVYFHANAVVDAPFASITPGARVTFVESAGDEGPQASTVHLVEAAGHA
jgi:ribosome-associated translation inhibitor RaiA